MAYPTIWTGISHKDSSFVLQNSEERTRHNADLDHAHNAKIAEKTELQASLTIYRHPK